jgi:hypothetical protein
LSLLITAGQRGDSPQFEATVQVAAIHQWAIHQWL